jgi:AraC family transcriptional regulator
VFFAGRLTNAQTASSAAAPSADRLPSVKAARRSGYVALVQRTIEFIAKHLDEVLDYDGVAREAGLSSFHFHRMFAGMVGETALELARRLRLERAAWRLANTRQSVTGIAFDSGFESHEAFTRAFRLRYDTSPSGFRRRAYRRIVLSARCGIHYSPNGDVPSLVRYESGGDMHVDIRTMPGVRLGTVRHRGPYNQIPTAFATLGQRLGAQAGALMQRGSAMMAMYYDDPDTVPLDQLRSDAGVVIPDDIPVPDGLIEQHVAGGQYACAVHVGPYEHIGDTWARLLGEWLPASGQQLGTGPSYERYLNNPSNAAPEELRTEICIPLA